MKNFTKESFHQETQSIIKEARIELGLDQGDMAKILMVSQGTISKIENKKCQVDLFTWYNFMKFIDSKNLSTKLSSKIDSISSI